MNVSSIKIIIDQQLKILMYSTGLEQNTTMQVEGLDKKCN